MNVFDGSFKCSWTSLIHSVILTCPAEKGALWQCRFSSFMKTRRRPQLQVSHSGSLLWVVDLDPYGAQVHHPAQHIPYSPTRVLNTLATTSAPPDHRGPFPSDNTGVMIHNHSPYCTLLLVPPPTESHVISTIHNNSQYRILHQVPLQAPPLTSSHVVSLIDIITLSIACWTTRHCQPHFQPSHMLSVCHFSHRKSK